MSRSLINTNGYLKNSENKNNKINIIPSSDITMKGVEFPVMATPVYQGVLGKDLLMKPGKEYKFDNADFVIERKLKKGGKMRRLKIMAQEGYNFMKPVNWQDPLLRQRGLNPQNLAPTYNINETVDFSAPENVFSYENSFSDLANEDEDEYQPYYNPNGDYSVEDAFNVMGSSVESGNALGMLGSAGKIITGGLRNFKSGQATEREKMRRRNEMFEKQNRGLRSYKDAISLQLGGTRRPINEIIK